MWTHDKIHKAFRKGLIYVTVKYTDGDEDFTEEYPTKTVTGIWPDNIIRARLAELNAVDLSKIELGTGLKEQPTPEERTPTPAEVARNTFFRNLHALTTIVNAKVAASRGETELEQWVRDLAAAVKNQYKPEYFQ